MSDIKEYNQEFKEIIDYAINSYRELAIKHTAPRILFIDIETLANRGYFFDTYTDRSIPLQFITDPKAICTVAWKFAGEEPTVIRMGKPYYDKDLCERILEVFEQADYVVWHFGEGFDRKFIEGRLFVNGLPGLPPVASIDTYKLAKAKWGKTLNSNKLDHIANLMGLGRKNKTDASLWVRCAEGDLEAIEEMAEYNKQDVILLEAVYNKLAPNVSTKVNHNILHDRPTVLCKPCGSENMTWKRHTMTPTTIRHRYQCGDCGSWSTFAKRRK